MDVLIEEVGSDYSDDYDDSTNWEPETNGGTAETEPPIVPEPYGGVAETEPPVVPDPYGGVAETKAPLVPKPYGGVGDTEAPIGPKAKPYGVWSSSRTKITFNSS